MPTNTWYYEIRYFMINGIAHNNLAPKDKRYLRLKCAKYRLIDGLLFRKQYGNFLLCCLENPDAEKVMTKLHNELARGHFGGETIVHKIL